MITFINMITLLFQNIVVSISINNQVTKLFGIHRGARQGCPLAPYMFITVAVKNAVRTSLLKATSFNAIPQQIISQYVEGTSFIMRAEESSVDNLAEILNNFGLASSLKMY